MGSALSEESIADFAAAELASAQNSASPAVKPRRIANRVRVVDDASPQQQQQQQQQEDGDALDSEEGLGNVALRGAAMTIQRALRAKKEAGLLEKRSFNIADISKAVIKVLLVEGKRKP